MIHFDFIVDDVDAETIMACLQDRINKMNKEIQDYMFRSGKEGRDFRSEICWNERHIEYIKKLKLKMTNTRVEEKGD